MCSSSMMSYVCLFVLLAVYCSTQLASALPFLFFKRGGGGGSSSDGGFGETMAILSNYDAFSGVANGGIFPGPGAGVGAEFGR